MIRRSRNPEFVCLITLCFDMMIFNTAYGQAAPGSNCNICHNDIYIKHPDNQVDVIFLGFDENVQDMISCQQLYDAGNTNYISEEQCKLIHTHESGIQLQKLCGCTSEIVEEVTAKRISSSTTLESSTSLSQLKALALIKEPETKGIETLSNVTIPTTIDDNSTETTLQHGSSNGTTDHHTISNVTIDGNATQDIEAYENNAGKPVVSKPTKQTESGKKSKSPVVSGGTGGGKLKPTAVLKPNKMPIDATVATPTVAGGVPVVKKSPTAQSMSTTTTKPHVVVMKPNIDKPSKIKYIKEGKVPVVASTPATPTASAPVTPTTTTVEMPTTIIVTKPLSNPMKMSLGDVKR